MSLRRLPLAEATRWITDEALDAASADGPCPLPERVAERLQTSRRSALALLGRLQALGWLAREGTARRPRWAPGAMRQIVRHWALAGLDEDIAWRRDVAPRLSLPPAVARIAQHAFGELVNNAVDHSGGSRVTVSLRQTPLHLQLLVADDGCGLFDRVRDAFAIEAPEHAMLELAKGRLTSDPARHAGRGLAGLARLADFLDLHANARAFQHRGGDEGRRWHAAKAMPSATRAERSPAPHPARTACGERRGTAVYFAVALDTRRSVDDAWLETACAGGDPSAPRVVASDTTAHVPLALIAGPGAHALDSRAQARRVAARLAQFRRAELDFDGIDGIGHGFADELFRVFAREFPAVDLVPVRAGPRVAAMVDAIRAPRR